MKCVHTVNISLSGTMTVVHCKHIGWMSKQVLYHHSKSLTHSVFFIAEFFSSCYIYEDLFIYISLFQWRFLLRSKTLYQLRTILTMLKGNLFVGLLLIFNMFYSGCYLIIIFLCLLSVYDLKILLSTFNLVYLSNVWHCAIIYRLGHLIIETDLFSVSFYIYKSSGNEINRQLDFMECIIRKESLHTNFKNRW